jgi:Tol biopolymer transport system component
VRLKASRPGTYHRQDAGVQRIDPGSNLGFQRTPVVADGKIAFASIQGGPHEYIYVVNTDGSGLTEITHGSTYGDILPAWSPDGARIAFVRIAPSGNKDIYVVSADGTNAVRLTTTAAFEGTPAWSPDGRTIALTRFSGRRAAMIDRSQRSHKRSHKRRGAHRDSRGHYQAKRVRHARFAFPDTDTEEVRGSNLLAPTRRTRLPRWLGRG